MMKGRHLDQTIMCSVYGMARVSDMQLQFKDIISKYKDQPHSMDSRVCGFPKHRLLAVC